MLHSLIAIDGGGTKTAALLVDGNGNVQAEALVSATNPNSLSEEVVQSRIEALLTKLKVQAEHAYEEVRFVFAGMAGGDREPAKTVFKEAIRHHFSVEPTIYVDHDAVTALYSGTYGQPGIASIAGTGSIVFGVNEYGDRDRLGGWGYLLEDAGSGFELGRQAVLHCMNEFDLKRVPSPLSEAVLAHFQVERANELISLIYEPGKTRERIAPLSEQVCNLAVDGQPEAERIVREAAHKNAEAMVVMAERLFQHPPDQIVIAGSVYKSERLWRELLGDLLKEKLPDTTLTRPVYPVLAGAVAAADMNIGQTRTDEQYEKIFEQITIVS